MKKKINLVFLRGLALFTLFWLLIMYSACAPNGEKVATIDGHIDQIDLSKTCVKEKSQIVMPSIKTINGEKVSKDLNKPLETAFGVVELEITNFDKNFPPVIKIYDAKSDELLDSIHFNPLIYPCENPIPFQKVPVYLAYDKTPWLNADGLPVSRVTRIELHMPVLQKSEKVYAKLHHSKYGGVYVVPIAWHNMTKASYGGKTKVDNKKVFDLFWTAPTMKNYVPTIVSDVNTILAQAGLQAKLVDTGIPFAEQDIPTIVLKGTETPDASTNCLLGWKKMPGHKEAVDFYIIDGFTNNPSVAGIGNCRVDGMVLIREDDYDNSTLIAHELATHYLATLCHPDKLIVNGNDIGKACRQKYNISDADLLNNLTSTQLSGWQLNDTQCKDIRNQLKNTVLTYKGYHHEK